LSLTGEKDGDGRGGQSDDDRSQKEKTESVAEGNASLSHYPADVKDTNSLCTVPKEGVDHKV
jgi:hypothetical protein